MQRQTLRSKAPLVENAQLHTNNSYRKRTDRGSRSAGAVDFGR